MRISDWRSDVCSSDLRIGFHRLIKCISDFGKFLHIIDFFGNEMALSMNAAHKFGILPSGQRALQASTETHWPRHETMSFHHSPRRLVHAAYDAEQGGLASAITSYQTHIQFRRSEEHTSELQSLMRISYAVF